MSSATAAPAPAQPRPPAARPAVGGYLTLLLAVAVMVLPLVWMVLASFKGMDEIYRLPIQWLPESLAPTNYATATQTVPCGAARMHRVSTSVAHASWAPTIANGRCAIRSRIAHQ